MRFHFGYVHELFIRFARQTWRLMASAENARLF
jgi:hypothetical protein